MRYVLYILSSFLLVSCSTTQYLPNLWYNTTKPNIIIAKLPNTASDSGFYKACYKGLITHCKTNPDIGLNREIKFRKYPSERVLDIIEKKSNADGLLLLIKVKINDIEGTRLRKIPAKCRCDFPNPPPPKEEPGYPMPTLPCLHNEDGSCYKWERYSAIHLEVKSKWRYYSFKTGESHFFKIVTDQLYEYDEELYYEETFIEKNPITLSNLINKNGLETAQQLNNVNLQYKLTRYLY